VAEAEAKSHDFLQTAQFNQWLVSQNDKMKSDLGEYERRFGPLPQ
jgi:hypothetical protein